MNGGRVLNANDAVRYRLAVGQRFAERLSAGDSVVQLGVGGAEGIPCTVSDGVVKTLSHVNALVAMQVMKDRGVVDPRFFSLGQIEKAGWTLVEGAVGIGMQYLVPPGGADGLDGDGVSAVTKRFRVFHAGDVKGCGAWVRPEPVSERDLVKGLEALGVLVEEEGLGKAITTWAGEGLKSALVATWLEAETGLAGVVGGERGAVLAVAAQAVRDEPLGLYTAVGEAERLVATVMSQARSAQFERKTEEVVLASEPATDEVSQDNEPVALNATAAGGGMRHARKVSARVANLFEERQAVLAVPFKEREKAKALGAVWHDEKRIWFVPPKVDLAAFKVWNLGENSLGETASQAMLIEDFQKAMVGMGLVLPRTFEADAKWHNVCVDNGKTARPGSYLLNLQGGRDGVPCGSICNRLSGERLPWRYEGALLTPEQRARFRAEAQAREAAAAREEKMQHDAAAVHAKEIWNMGVVPGEYGYVARKGISGVGVREVSGETLLAYDEFHGESGRSMIRARETYTIVPLTTTGGEIRALQAISPDGKVKSFMRGAQKSGLMCVLGGESLDALVACECPVIAYAEGLATGDSFRDGRALPVVVCFDAGNMETVVQATAGVIPKDTLKILALDNDQFHVERAMAVLAKTVGVNPYSANGDCVDVVAQHGSACVAETRRSVAIGEVVPDGEWHQGPKGKYCITVEYEPDGLSVRSLAVEMVPEDGRKVSQRFSNRGAEVGRALEGVENCVAMSPWFRSLEGQPTDWNDLATREGRERVDYLLSDQLDEYNKKVMWATLMGAEQHQGRGKQDVSVGGIER